MAELIPSHMHTSVHLRLGTALKFGPLSVKSFRLTYLRPTGANCGVECEGMNMMVVEVEPTFGS